MRPNNLMSLPVIDPRTQSMTKTDQIAMLRVIETLIGMLPEETQNRLLWEAAEVARRKRDPKTVDSMGTLGIGYAVYNTRAEVERAPGKAM